MNGGSTPVRNACSRIQLLGHRGERPATEDRLYRQAEVLRRPQGKVQARVVLAALQVADRLVVHAQRVGQGLAGEAAFGAEDRETVVQRGFGSVGCACHARSAGASGSIQVSCLLYTSPSPRDGLLS